jgi:hypothetical protein
MPRYIDADNIDYTVTMVGRDEYAGYRAVAFESDIDAMPTADVVPRAEGGAECHICHGTGRIGTTDWLTKHLSEKQLAEEKAKAIAEHEQHIKAEVAREIFEEINAIKKEYARGNIDGNELYIHLYRLEKKYTEEQKQ